MFKDKVLLITGGTGSFGNAVVRRFLDTDIGGDIDDAWALGFVLSHADFEPLGVTICDGNTPVRAKVACKCDLCGGDPQCVKFCISGALQYVEAEEAFAFRRASFDSRLKDVLGLARGDTEGSRR